MSIKCCSEDTDNYTILNNFKLQPLQFCFPRLKLFSLNSKELREGGKILVEKLKKFKPLIAVFNGKCKKFVQQNPL